MTPIDVVFGCSHCDATFVTAEGLRAHAVRHHRYRPVRSPLPEPPQSSRSASLTFTCSQCGKVFASRWQLRNHLSDHGVFAAPEWQPSDARQPRIRPVPVELSARSRRAARGAPARRTALARARRARHKRVAARVAVATAAVLIILAAASSAMAMFSSSAKVLAAVSTATWGDELTFSPGSALAVHPSATGSTFVRPIASLDAHGLPSLDFGAVDPSSTRHWADVFRLTSKTTGQISVSFDPGGPIAAFVGQVTLSGDQSGSVLTANETRSVEVGLTMTHVDPGTYDGTLRVAVEGSDEAYAIPMTVAVGTPTDTPSPSASPSQSPSTSPSPSPTASGTPSVPEAGGLFGLAPGASTTLAPPDGSARPLIAVVQTDGTVALDFGQVPAGAPTTFDDVVRMEPQGADADVRLDASGPIAAVIRQVGFWDGSQGLITSGLVLSNDTAQQIAFELAVPQDATPGTLDGQLHITATSADGHTQTSLLAMKVTIPAAPSDSPSPSSSVRPSTSPTTASSPTTAPSPNATTPPPATSSPAPATSPTPEPTPTPADTPPPAPADPSSPSPSPSASSAATASVMRSPMEADSALVLLLRYVIGPTVAPLPEFLGSWPTRSVAFVPIAKIPAGF